MNNDMTLSETLSKIDSIFESIRFNCYQWNNLDKPKSKAYDESVDDERVDDKSNVVCIHDWLMKMGKVGMY